MTLYLNESRPRSLFKSLLGQANHFIITVLVGLDAIEKRIVTKAPPELHAVWSPKDAVISSRRSRRMVLDMALVRAVDGLDIYIRQTNKKPFIAQDEQLRKKLDGIKHSVFERFKAVDQHYPQLDPRLAALMELMIAWRNRRVHSEADNDIATEKWELLRNNAAWISAEFCDLDVDRLMQDFDDTDLPAFREIASLINACQRFVGELEALHFRALDKVLYLQQTIWAGINAKEDRKAVSEAVQKRRLQSIWGRDTSERQSYVIKYLINHGFSEAKAFPEAAIFDSALISTIGEMTPSTVYEWCMPAAIDR